MFKKYIINSLLLLLFVSQCSLYAKEQITLKWLKTKPRSVTKDFYIWQFLQTDITPQEAALALGEAKNVNNTLFALYAKKFNHDETYAVLQCQNATAKELINTSSDCLRVGLSVNKALELNYLQKNQAIEIVQEKYPAFASLLKILNAPLPFTKLLAAPSDIFFETFNSVKESFIKEHFNYKIPTNILNKLAQSSQFNATIEKVVTNKELNNLQESLLKPFDTSKLNFQSLFLLSINALKYKSKELAISYLKKAQKKAYFKNDIDKLNFWLYFATSNEEFLKKLSSSYAINIYSIYAKDRLNKTFSNALFTLLDSAKKSDSSFEATDPFAWIEVLNKIEQDFDYEAIFNTKQTEVYLAYILEKKSNYQTFYFLTPYDDYLKEYNNRRKALIYSIAKQESRFIPTAISCSYALGAMQLKPLVSKQIAKELKEVYDLQEQLNPKVSVKYANYYLDKLEKEFNNPLYIALAYNGGASFVKKLLEQGFIEKQREFEPFLSIELMPNTKLREYGKQVLANYYIYINHLDKKNRTKLTTVLENL